MDILDWLNEGSEAVMNEAYDAKEVTPTRYVSSPRSEAVDRNKQAIREGIINKLKSDELRNYARNKMTYDDDPDSEEGIKAKQYIDSLGDRAKTLDVAFENERWSYSQNIINNTKVRNQLAKENFEKGNYNNELEGEYYENLQNSGALMDSGWWDMLDMGAGMLARRFVKTAAESTDFNDSPEEYIARFFDPNITRDQKLRMLKNCTPEQRAAVYSTLSDKAVNASVLEGDYKERIEDLEMMMQNPDDEAKWSHGLSLLDFAMIGPGFGMRQMTAFTKPFARRFAGMTDNKEFMSFLTKNISEQMAESFTQGFKNRFPELKNISNGETINKLWDYYGKTNERLYNAATEYLGWKNTKVLDIMQGSQFIETGKTILKAGDLGFREAAIRTAIAADSIVATMIANGDFNSRAGRIWLSNGDSIRLDNNMMDALRSLSNSQEAPVAENIGKALFGYKYENAERAASAGLKVTDDEKNMLLEAKEIEDNIKKGSEYWLDENGLVKRKEYTDMQTMLVQNTVGDFNIPASIDVAVERNVPSAVNLNLSKLGKINAEYKEITNIYDNLANVKLGNKVGIDVFDTKDININVKEIIPTTTIPLTLKSLADKCKGLDTKAVVKLLTDFGVNDAVKVANEIITFNSNKSNTVDLFGLVKKFYDDLGNKDFAGKYLIGSPEFSTELFKFLKTEMPNAQPYEIYQIQNLIDLHGNFRTIVMDEFRSLFGELSTDKVTWLEAFKKSFAEAIESTWVSPSPNTFPRFEENLKKALMNNGVSDFNSFKKIDFIDALASKITQFSSDSIERIRLNPNKAMRKRMSNLLFKKLFEDDSATSMQFFGNLLDNLKSGEAYKLGNDAIRNAIFHSDFNKHLKDGNIIEAINSYGRGIEKWVMDNTSIFKDTNKSSIDIGREILITTIDKNRDKKYILETAHKGLKQYLKENPKIYKDAISQIKGGYDPKYVISSLIADYAYSMDTANTFTDALRIFRTRGADVFKDSEIKSVVAEASKRMDDLIKNGKSESGAFKEVLNDKEFFNSMKSKFEEFQKLVVKEDVVRSSIAKLYELHKQGKEVTNSDDLKEIFKIIDKSGGDISNVKLSGEDLDKIIQDKDFLASTILNTSFERLKPAFGVNYKAADVTKVIYGDGRDYLLGQLFSHPKDSIEYKAAKEAYRLQTEIASIYFAKSPAGKNYLASAATNTIYVYTNGMASLNTMIHELKHNLTNAALNAYENGYLPSTSKYYQAAKEFIENVYMPHTIEYVNDFLHGIDKSKLKGVLNKLTLKNGVYQLSSATTKDFEALKSVASFLFEKVKKHPKSNTKFGYGFKNPHEMCATASEFESDGWVKYLSNDIINSVKDFSRKVSEMPIIVDNLTINKNPLIKHETFKKHLIGNIINWNAVDSNAITSLAFKDPSLMGLLRDAKSPSDAKAIVEDYFGKAIEFTLKEEKGKIEFADAVKKYADAIKNGDSVDDGGNLKLVKGVYEYLTKEKGVAPDKVAEAIRSGKYNKEVSYYVVENAFDPLAEITYQKYEKWLGTNFQTNKAQRAYADARLSSGVSDDKVVESIVKDSQAYADKLENKINNGWNQFFDETRAKPFNPIAQMNTIVPANSLTRAKATAEAMGGKDYTSLGLDRNETIMSTFAPSVGERRQPVDMEELANLLIEQSVDVTTEGEKAALIKDIREKLSRCNASGLDISIEGTFEKITGTFSNEANSGWSSLEDAQISREMALRELKELGVAPQEISIMGADSNGILSVAQKGGNYDKYYLSITHSNDISSRLTGSTEAVMKVAGIFDANPLTRFVRDYSASASRIYGEDLIRPLMASHEKATGLQDIAFSKAVKDFKVTFANIKGDRHNKFYETIFKQNQLGMKEGRVYSDFELRGMGHTSDEISALKQLWDIQDKIWYYKNLNNARKLSKEGFVAVNAKDGTMIGKLVKSKLEDNVKAWDTFSGMEVEANSLTTTHDIFTFATDRGRRGTNYFAVPKGTTTREINWKFDQTIGRIPGYTDLRLKEGMRYVEKDGKTFAVASNTLDAEDYAKGMGWAKGSYSVRPDRDYKSTGLGSKMAQRDGIELLGDLTMSDAYLNPLESMDRGIAYAMNQVEVVPVLEQAERNFVQVYGKFSNGKYPKAMADIVGNTQEANAARSVYNYIERMKNSNSGNIVDDTFKAVLNHIAESLGKWSVESGGAMSEVYSLGEKAALDLARANPLTWARHRVSQFYIAAHPVRQFFLQGIQLANAMAVDPQSVLTGKMTTQMTDLILSVTDMKKISAENEHMYDLFTRMGLLSTESSVAWIQEAMKVSPGSNWDNVMNTLGKGALFGEKMQVLGQACCEYNKTVREFGKEWFNNKKNFDSFITKVRIMTGSQNPAERMPWENGLMGCIFQFVQSPWKMNQLIFSKQVPLSTRMGIALNEIMMFGAGTYGTSLVYDNLVGKKLGASLDDDTREIIKGGLFDMTVAKLFGMQFDTKNFSPTNYEDMVNWFVKAAGYKETEAAKYLSGDWTKSDTEKHNNGKKWGDVNFLSQAGERMSIPMASFAKYRLWNVVKDTLSFINGNDERAPWDTNSAKDVVKDIVSLFSGGKAALNAYIAMTTGEYLNSRGAHLKFGLDNRQALGMLIFNPDVTPEERSAAYKEIAYKDPDAYLTTAFDSAMTHVAGLLRDTDLKKVETSEYTQRLFDVMNLLRTTWTKGDPKKEDMLKKHIMKRLKEAQQDDYSAYSWVLSWFKERLKKGRNYYEDAVRRWREQDPRAYQTVHDRVRAISKAQKTDFEDEQYKEE